MKANANGFSLVEVVIATVVLSIGMLAMAASTGYVAAEIRNATMNSQRAAAREQVVEQLRASVFDNVATTTTPLNVGRYRMTWTVTSINNFNNAARLRLPLHIDRGRAERRRRDRQGGKVQCVAAVQRTVH